MENLLNENTTDQWLLALTIFAISLIAFRFLLYLIKKRFMALARRTETDIDDLAIKIIQETRWFFIALTGFFFAARVLTIDEEIFVWIRTGMMVSLFIQIGFWGHGLLAYFVARETKEELDEGDTAEATTIQALGFLGRLLIWAVAILMALDNIPGVEITSLIASLGIGGIAVALAVQNVLSDLFASLSILLDKPFVIGDYVVIDDLEGEIEKIGLKSTRVRSISGEQLVFGNADLLNSRIRNFKRMERRRNAFSFSVTYQTTTEQLKAIPAMIQKLIDDLPGITFDRSHLQSLGQSSLQFETVYYVDSPDFSLLMDTQQQINLAMFELFQKEGIKFAHPTQTVFVEQ